MSFVLGVDAGNTKTIAVLAGLDGRIVGSGRGGCGDILGAGSSEKALAAVAELCVAGKLAPSIDRRLSLHEVPDALRYAGEGRARGKVVINLDQG
jgi:N-acetylglucosamine kinase-like BadF-type ATPase